MRGASSRITDEVTSWAGVTTADGNWGAFCFMVGRVELGHLHGDRSAHFGFPKDVWAELHQQGRVEDHPMFPGKPGICARRIETDADVRDVIELLRLSYDRTVARHGPPAKPRRPSPADPRRATAEPLPGSGAAAAPPHAVVRRVDASANRLLRSLASALLPTRTDEDATRKAVEL